MDSGSTGLLRRGRDPTSMHQDRHRVGGCKSGNNCNTDPLPGSQSKSNLELQREIAEVMNAIHARDQELKTMRSRIELHRRNWNQSSGITDSERRESLKRFVRQHSRSESAKLSKPPQYIVDIVERVRAKFAADGGDSTSEETNHDEDCGSQKSMLEGNQPCKEQTDSTSSVSTGDHLDIVESEGESGSWRIGSKPIPKEALSESPDGRNHGARPVRNIDAEIQTSLSSKRWSDEVNCMEVEWKAKVAKLEAELSAERSSHRAVQLENSKLKAKIVEAEQGAQERDLIKAQLAKIALDRNRLGCLVLEKEQQSKNLADEVEKVRQANAELDRTLTKSRSVLVGLKANLDKLTGEKEALLALHKEDEQVQAANARKLGDAVRKLEADLQEKHKELEESEGLRRKPSQQRAKGPFCPNLLREENDLLRQKLIERDMEMEELVGQHHKKAKAFEAADEKIALLEADVDQWRRDFKGLLTSKQKIQKESEAAKKHLDKLNRECDGFPLERIRSLKKSLAQERQESTLLRQRIVDLQEG